MKLLDNPIAVMFLSFIVGMLGNACLRRLRIYDRFGNRYLFSGLRSYEKLGVLLFRKVLLATPLRLFNNDIRFSESRSLETLVSVREHMVNAEVAHWIGFATMLLVNAVAWRYRGFETALAYLPFNIAGNLYPCLLQQYNRRRLARVIAAFKARNAGADH